MYLSLQRGATCYVSSWISRECFCPSLPSCRNGGIIIYVTPSVNKHACVLQMQMRQRLQQQQLASALHPFASVFLLKPLSQIETPVGVCSFAKKNITKR